MTSYTHGSRKEEHHFFSSPPQPDFVTNLLAPAVLSQASLDREAHIEPAFEEHRLKQSRAIEVLATLANYLTISGDGSEYVGSPFVVWERQITRRGTEQHVFFHRVVTGEAAGKPSRVKDFTIYFILDHSKLVSFEVLRNGNRKYISVGRTTITDHLRGQYQLLPSDDIFRIIRFIGDELPAFDQAQITSRAVESHKPDRVMHNLLKISEMVRLVSEGNTPYVYLDMQGREVTWTPIMFDDHYVLKITIDDDFIWLTTKSDGTFASLETNVHGYYTSTKDDDQAHVMQMIEFVRWQVLEHMPSSSLSFRHSFNDVSKNARAEKFIPSRLSRKKAKKYGEFREAILQHRRATWNETHDDHDQKPESKQSPDGGREQQHAVDPLAAKMVGEIFAKFGEDGALLVNILEPILNTILEPYMLELALYGEDMWMAPLIVANKMAVIQAGSASILATVSSEQIDDIRQNNLFEHAVAITDLLLKRIDAIFKDVPVATLLLRTANEPNILIAGLRSSKFKLLFLSFVVQKLVNWELYYTAVKRQHKKYIDEQPNA